VRGVEALVRWAHPVRGLVPPSTFIPVAEETGDVLALGRWVLRAACAAAATWHRTRSGAPYVAVNLSARQLAAPDLVADVAAALVESGLPPGALLLEVTESVVMEETASNLRRLHELKRLGVRLAIDDFGTGYSSLAYLQRFPVDVLKIDKRFVDGVAESENDAALARAIITLGSALGLETVAEGIEHPAQRQRLMALGCRLGQGYLFARPMAVADLADFLDAPAAAAVA
jgi:EAL domain-containing protein (putative c-di-GMP-specific phosphodiesterase class I)